LGIKDSDFLKPALMPDKYLPINCSFYDRLEAAATLKQTVTLRYKEGSAERIEEGIIVDLFIRDGAEYLQTERGFTLRLDDLVALDEWEVPPSC
jgi:Rho-binding antiterminator